MTPQADQELRNALFLAQYQSAREVVLHARQIQHSIVSWSSAAAGVLIGSGAVIAAGGTRSATSGTSGAALLLLFSIVLPGLVAGSFNAWIGEIARMRRAAKFLRDIEFTVRESIGPGWPPTPTYDTVVSRSPDGKGDAVTTIGRRAVAGLDIGLFAVSVGVASAVLWNLDVPEDHALWFRVAVEVAMVGSLSWFIHAVRDGFRRVVPYATRTPTRMDESFLAGLFAADSDSTTRTTPQSGD